MALKGEKLNINHTPATLFIGVGGIGSEIVVKVANRCKDGETKNIRFVAMDTNANDLRDVKSANEGVVHIQTSSTQSVKDYLDKDASARTKWFPNNTTLYPKTVSEGAGQVRAISRLALNATIKTGEIQKLYKAIDDLFLKDGGDLKQALRVVICSSIAGGTGSGIAMTVGMIVREYLHKHYREKSAIIRGFLLLPGVMDTVISSASEKESLRRNGYATIKEINSFMIKASGFCGVRRDLERFKDLHIEIPTTTGGTEKLENLPFDFCFLLDRVDQRQESMQTLEQYKEFAAQSLYEQNIGPMQRKAFSMEDNIIKEFANGENLGRNRFGGIGAAVLRYPYEDVADYIAFSRAIDRIGSSETAGEWLKYDNEYKVRRAEFKKKRAMTTEKEPTIAEIYVEGVNNDETRFGVDVKSYLANDINDVATEVSEDLMRYLFAFKEEIKSSFVEQPEIVSIDAQVRDLTVKKDYEGNENYRGKATRNLNTIRTYESQIKKMAATTAKGRAKSILYNAPSLSQDVKPYHLESILKTSKGGMHPNAVRYMLYALKCELEKEYEEGIRTKLNRSLEDLQMYAPGHRSEKFDVKGTKEEECTIEQICALDRNTGSESGLLSKLGGKKGLWEALNKHLPNYSSSVIAYRDAVLNEAAYNVAMEYVDGLSKELERFYASFGEKVVSLTRSKEDIVDKLKFRKGDSICYVCATQKHLDRLAEICPESSDGLLLPDELNADIFDSVKMNAESSRLSQYDPYGDNQKEDIFDNVLIDYFRESVRKDCAEVIDLDIIRALLTEQKFNEFFKANAFLADDEPQVIPVITDDARTDYLKDNIGRGNKLAAPGIACANFNEPREIKVCAFNKALANLRNVDVKKLLEVLELSPVSTDTVSKYDLRFFTALYNITPDKLARFRAPEECAEDDAYDEKGGIYYQAYQKHINKIGPDSTKSACISLHIDKRWDSLTEMPEISMSNHSKEMMRIHSALIYGIVHGMIRTYPSSRYDSMKRIYQLEDMEGELTKFIVSNNTECDEFYEVLDALYRDRASVAKIYDMAEARRQYDIDSNHRYSESAFVKDLDNFRIGDGHREPVSLFEIPLTYYNSLPRSKMDDNELSIMIDSVIDVLEQEVNRYEQEIDRDPFLSNQLEEQFMLFIENFKNEEYNKNDAMRKNTSIQDNRVVNMVFRKVSNKIKKLNTYRFSEKIDRLRMLMRD
ncbi:MAG: tubulin-like doman-containing protein [Schaedlerella sp.]|nr:tubulin-like doman-containing protein [Schaedlerella sp.]